MSEQAQDHRILVIEDNQAVASLLHAVLASYHYQVELADDVSALQASREHLPHLILLDLQMPTMSGDVALSHLRTMPETRDIPVVLMSGVGDIRYKARTLGVAGYLRKPFELDDLLGVVTNALT